MNPTARTTDLHVERLADEALIYDLTTHESHCLSPEAAAIWDAATGTRDVNQIAQACDQNPVAVVLTLEKLEKLGLMEAGPTRRDSLKYAAVAAGIAAASIPVISSLAAPTAALAASLAGSGASCTDGSQCASSVCSNGTCL
jgi:hypothetical protein